MITKSLHYKIPAQAPFDQTNWFETFVGSFVVPLVATGHIQSYWFSHYEDGELGKHARFRIRTENPVAIEAKEKELAAYLKLRDLADEPNYGGGEIRDADRFLGTNQRQADRDARYELIWDFLHASSKLFVDCLSHQDADERWSLESTPDVGNCADRNTVESFHHLFCNLTGLEPLIYETNVSGWPRLMSHMYYVARHCQAREQAGMEPFKSLQEIPAPVAQQKVQF